MDQVLSDRAVVAASGDQASCPLGDDVIILDLKAGMYFSLNHVGARIWQLIQQQPRTVAELRQAVLDTFEVTPEVCERDLVALLGALAAKNLVEIRDAASV
jgi:hypothetical protein